MIGIALTCPSMNRFIQSVLRCAMAIAFLLAAGCDRPGAAQVHEARVVLPPPGMQMAAGYFRLENRGGHSVELRAVSSPTFESVEMHRTVTEQGVSRMREVKALPVAAGASAQFEPGGLHLMMFGFKQDVASLREIPMTLELVGADGEVQHLPVRFTVESATEQHAH